MMLDLAQNPSPEVKIPTLTIIHGGQKIGPLPIITHPYSLMQVPTTQLAKMTIDPKFVELTADVLEKFYIKYIELQTLIDSAPGPRISKPTDLGTISFRCFFAGILKKNTLQL